MQLKLLVYKIYFHIFILLCLSTIFLGINSANANQSKFSKTLVNEDFQFNYQWLDHQKIQQSLSFKVPADFIYNHFRGFKTYKPHIATKVIIRNIQKKLATTSLQGVRFEYPQLASSLSLNTAVKVTGSDPLNVQKAYAVVEKVRQEEEQRYFATNYYRTHIDHLNTLGVKIDHARIAKESIKSVKPISETILDTVSKKDVRLVTNFILGFMQNIPYDTLESKSNSSGSGFNPPMKLLFENQGDCDSKMALSVALLKATMPGIKIVIVYIDQHVFLGINAKQRTGDKMLQFEDELYVLADPAGPSVLSLGEISPSAELAINQSAYVVEPYIK